MDIKQLSDEIALRSSNESEYFPIDRYFLEPYVKEILRLDRKEFLFYNFERGDTLYTTNLMLCLPELWEDISVSELIAISNEFTNIFSFYSLILFTYKYVEIDIIKLILSLNISNLLKDDIRSYLRRQYNNLLKSDGEIFVIDESVIGVKLQDWLYVKQKFLLDKRIEPALNSIPELKLYIESLNY